MVADLLAQRHRMRFEQDDGNYAFFQARLDAHEICVLKPLTFMNLSGQAVQHAVERWNIDESHLIVVYDDFNLGFGTLRLRAKGSDGGHNGMASIIYHLMSERFPRLRIGIRNDNFMGDAVDFVLSSFDKDEETHLAAIIEESANAVESIVLNGLVKTMNAYNRNILNELP
jgi:PTH1 family peptidyl-tRNA hydrolase